MTDPADMPGAQARARVTIPRAMLRKLREVARSDGVSLTEAFLRFPGSRHGAVRGLGVGPAGAKQGDRRGNHHPSPTGRHRDRDRHTAGRLVGAKAGRGPSLTPVALSASLGTPISFPGRGDPAGNGSENTQSDPEPVGAPHDRQRTPGSG